MTPTWWARVALVALGIALIVAAIQLVPWRTPRPARAARATALRDLPAAMVSRGRGLHASLRPSSYGSLLAGVVAWFFIDPTRSIAGSED